jgi:hypothetical protein
MYYAMQMVSGVASRTGRMTTKLDTAKRIATRSAGWVEEYGVGCIWLSPRCKPH